MQTNLYNWKIRVLCFLLLLNISCSEEDNWEVTGVTTPSIEVSAASKIFSYTGGDESVDITFENIQSWEVKGEIPDWLTIQPMSGGQSESATLQLSVPESALSKSRATEIEIIAYGGKSGKVEVSETLKIKQTPDPELAEIDSYQMNHLFLVQNNGDSHDNGLENITYKMCSAASMLPLSDGYGGYGFGAAGNFLSFDINISSLDNNGFPPAGTYSLAVSDKTAGEFTFDYGHYYSEGYYGGNVGTFFGTVNASGTITSTKYVTDGTIELIRSGDRYEMVAYLFDENDNEFICKYDGKLEVFEGYGEVQRDLTISSSSLVAGSVTSVHYSVILPEGYSSDKKYPVLYLLHGYGGDNNSWLDDGNAKLLTSNAIEDGVVKDFIVVMPDGFNAFYCNGFENNYQYKTFFFGEFIPEIETEFSIDTTRRAIAGLSMGGFGTLYNTFLHPGMFDLAYAMSPAIGVFGGINLNSLATQAGNSGEKLPKVVIACGTSDFVVYDASSFQSFSQTITNAGFEHELILDPGYSHAWDYWQLCYPRVMNELGKIW